MSISGRLQRQYLREAEVDLFDNWIDNIFHKKEKESFGAGKEKRKESKEKKKLDPYDESGYDMLGIHKDHAKHVAFNILKGNQLEIDLHGLNRERAAYMINDILDHADDRIEEIVLIHGYNSGTVLKEYIRGVLDHERISEEIFDFNNGGRTILKIGKKNK